MMQEWADKLDGWVSRSMKRRTRINYTPEQKAIIWDRYIQGDSLHDIARIAALVINIAIITSMKITQSL